MDWNLMGAVILSGIVIVFLILVTLIAVVSVTGRLVNKSAFEKKPPAAPAPPTQSAPASAPAAPTKGISPAPVVQSGIAQETVAVISASVAAVMDEQAPGVPYAVQSIQRQGRPVWGFAGMQQNTRPF